MRILIISHTAFSNTESMGKTLSNYFCEFHPGDLAQFYIQPQKPSSSICQRYYRLTDKEAFLSIFGLRKGTPFFADDLTKDGKSKSPSGLVTSLYKKGRKRTPLIYFFRNAMWSLSNWNNKKLRNWIDNFNPDCVFFASGDYSFMYKIALQIASSRRIPLYISCMDDYYFNNRNDKTHFGRFLHKKFMNVVKKTIAYSNGVFCICEKMSDDYSRYFNKKCYTLPTPASFVGPLNITKTARISYLGSLGHRRDDQLVEIGRTIKKIGLNPCFIDVYSSENRKEILSKLSIDNGIVFHGEINSSEVLKTIGESLAVIHTESFNEETRKSVKYSVSTKIADSLESGTCIFAYGPQEVASISYLNNNEAAFCCFEKNGLDKSLRRLIMDNEERNRIIINARLLAIKNHSKSNASKIIKNVIEQGA